MRFVFTRPAYKCLFSTTAVRCHPQGLHPNPLLCAPWLKALNGKFAMADLQAFCLEPTSDVPSFLHSKLKEAYEIIFIPAISENRQGTVKNGELKKVLVDNFTQHPVVIQTVNDFLNFAVNAMVSTKHPTLAHCIQLLPAHARLLREVHKHAGTKRPITIGFVTPAQHPFPANTPTIFATSVCQWATDGPDVEIRRIAHNYMRRDLETKLNLGTRLLQNAGRCVEDHAYLGLKDAMINQLPMYSLVLGIDYLLYPSKTLGVLLAATGGDDIQKILHYTKHWMFKMCPECRLIQGQLKAQVIDLAVY